MNYKRSNQELSKMYELLQFYREHNPYRVDNYEITYLNLIADILLANYKSKSKSTAQITVMPEKSNVEKRNNANNKSKKENTTT